MTVPPSPAAPLSRPWPRRALTALGAVAVMALVASACLPKAPPPEPPPVAAPPGTWRAEAEAFVQAAVPLLVGTGEGRETAGDGRVRGDQVVRTSPAAAAAAIATTPGGAAHAVDRADERLGTGLDGGARAAVATELAAGRIDEDEATVRLALAPGSPLAGLGDEAFVDGAYPMVVGRAADPGGRSYWLGRLGGGEARSSMVRSLARSGEARRLVVAAVHDELRLAPPSAGERDLYADLLGSTGGSTRALRAQLVTAALAPAPRDVGVMGDSVAFGLSFYLGAVQVGPVQHVRGGTKIGCGVLSARAGWQVQATDGSFHPPADGRCAAELPGLEADASRDAEVVLWITGAWEYRAYKSPAGTVVPARGGQMRNILVDEMTTRIDRWVANGAERVVLPEWGCVGVDAPAAVRSAEYRTWHTSVLRRVQAARPDVVSVVSPPPQLCNAEGMITAEHNAARGGETHWSSAADARWGWSNWYAPVVADVVLG